MQKANNTSNVLAPNENDSPKASGLSQSLFFGY